MSLEAALAENTAALLKVAALLEESNKGREAALAQLKTAAPKAAPAAAAEGEEAAPKTKRGRPTAAEREEKPVEKPVEKKEEPKKVAHPSQDEVRKAAVAFMGVDDGAEKDRRREFMKAVMNEVTITPDEEGKVKIVNTVEEERAKVIGWFADFAAGKKVNFMADEDGPEAEEEEDDIG